MEKKIKFTSALLDDSTIYVWAKTLCYENIAKLLFKDLFSRKICRSKFYLLKGEQGIRA